MSSANQYANKAVLTAAINRAATERTSALTLGDSNCFRNNYGYQRGLELAMRRRFGTWGAGPFPGSVDENIWSGVLPGLTLTKWGASVIEQSGDGTGPLAIHRQAAYPASGSYDGSGGSPVPSSSYARVVDPFKVAPSTSGAASSRGTEMEVDTFPIALSNGFKIHTRDATFALPASPTTNGDFVLNVVQRTSGDTDSGSMIADSDTLVEGVTGTDGWADNSTTVPAGDYSGKDLFIRYGRLDVDAGNHHWYGPFHNMHQFLEDENKTTGSHTIPLFSDGGGTTGNTSNLGLKNHFTDFSGTYATADANNSYDPDNGIEEYLRMITNRLPANPTIIHYFFYAGNDNNASIPVATMSANIDTTITAIEARYTALSVGTANMVYVPVVYQHWAVAESLWQAMFDEYETKWSANAKVCPAYLSKYSAAELIANNWHEGASTVHLNDAGYEALSEELIADAVGKPTPNASMNTGITIGV